MALETITGNLTDFDWQGRPELHPVLVFTPVDEIGFNGTSGVFFPIPIEVYPVGAGGSWVTQLESSATQRNPDFHYDLSCKWLNSEGIPVGWAQSSYPVYVPVGGGNIGSIIKAPLIRGNVWISYDGEIPSVAVAGDLIFFVQTDDLDIVN